MLIHVEYNPSMSIVNYAIYSYEEDQVVNRIFSPEGTLLFEEVNAINDGSFKGYIDIKKFPGGTYIMKSDGEKSSSVQKLVINN